MSTGEQAAEVPRKNEDVTSLTAVSSVFTVASEAGLVSSKLEPTTSPGLDATEKATQVTSATVCVGGVSSHRQTSDGSNNDTPTTTPASSTTFNGEVNNNVFHQKKRNFKYKNNNNDRKTSDINENNTLKINKNNNDNNSSNNNKNKNNNSSNNNDNNDSLNNDNSSTDDSTCNKEEVDSIKRVDSGENEETGLFFNPIKAQAMVLMNAYDKGGVSTSTMGDLESCDFDSVRGITSTEKQFFQLRQKQLIDYQTKNKQEIQKFKSRQKQQFYPATSQSNYKLLTTKHPAACYQAANKQHSKPQNNSQMKPKYLQKYESPLENNINPANGTDFQKKHPLYNNINNKNINNNNINNNNINNNNISNSNINNNNINNNTSDININNNYTNTNNINDNNTNINENNDNITNNNNDKNNKDNNNNNDNKNNNNDPDKDNRIFQQQQQSEPHNHCKPYIAFDGSDGDLDDRQYSFLNYANFEMLKQENDWLKKELKEWKEKYECLLQMGDTKNSRIYKLQAETYKDDFHQERADREAAMGKLEEVEKKLKLAEETLSLYCMVYDMA